MWLHLPISVSSPVSPDSILDLPSLSQRLAASVTWNGKPRQSSAWLRELKKGALMTRLSGMMYEPSQAEAIVAAWLESLRGSPAPTTPLRAPERGSKESMENSGGTYSTSSKPSTPNGCCLKTCLVCSLPLDRDFDAYAAGLIDGEGSFTVRANKSKGMATVVVSITLVAKASNILNAICHHYGGSVRPLDRPRPKEAATIRWQMSGKMLVCVIRRILPFMTVKKAQATICLELLDRVWPLYKGREQVTEERLGLFLKAKQQVEALNQRGPEDLPKDYIAQLVGDRWMKRHTDLFGEHWETFSGRWPASGSLRSGVVFERQKWEPVTEGGESSYWPTAMSIGEKAHNQLSGQYREQMDKAMESFDAAAEHWPSRDFRSGETIADYGNERPLNEAVVNWATPRAEDGESAGNHLGASDSLTGQTSLWKTPTAEDSADREHARNNRGEPKLSYQAKTFSEPVSESSLPAQPTPSGKTCWCLDPGCGLRSHKRRLNPIFVTWLMGWPIWWVTSVPQPYAPQAMALWRSNAQRLLRSLLGGLVYSDSEIWMTPVADDVGTRTARYKQGGMALSMQTESWPTPRVEPGKYSMVKGVRCETSLDYVSRDWREPE